MTLRTFKAYLQDRNFAPDTIIGMQRTVNRYTRWLQENNTSAHKITHSQVIAFIGFLKTDLKMKPVTVNYKLGNLRHYYKYLEAKHYPFQDLVVRGHRKIVKMGLLSTEELKALYNNLPDRTKLEIRVKLLAGFFIFQGISTRDVTEMMVCNVELGKGCVTIPESRMANYRILPLDPVQMILLIKTLTMTKNKPIYQVFSNVERKWAVRHLQRELRKTDKISLRQIRYSVVTNWLKRSNLRQVQYNAGHRYISTTEEYLESDYEELRIAIIGKHPLG